jgi:pimeloyl-ACP methyl ester carboxylesterase
VTGEATVTLSDGAEIWCRKLGSGPAVLQIHGSAFGHRNFERLTPLLTDRFEVVDFDLPGYGQSRGGSRGRTLDGLADQVAEMICAIGYDRIHVHGTSFGAMVALTLAACHPERVDRLVLSCFLARYDNAARMMRATWKRAAIDSGMDAVADLTSVAGFARAFFELDWAEQQLQSMRDAFSRTAPEAFVTSTEAIERSDLSPLLDRVKSPLLLIAGEEDNMTPFRPAASGVGMAQIAEQLQTDTVVIPQCGHYLVIEAAERAAELVSRFLAA